MKKDIIHNETGLNMCSWIETHPDECDGRALSMAELVPLEGILQARLGQHHHLDKYVQNINMK